MLPKGLLKEYYYFLTILLRISDAAGVCIAGLIAYYFRFHTIYLTTPYVILLISGIFLASIVFSYFSLYQSMRLQSRWAYTLYCTEAIFVLFILFASFLFFTKTSEIFSRTFFLLWGICTLFLLILFRNLLFFILRKLRTLHLNTRKIVIIGANTLSDQLSFTIRHMTSTGLKISNIFKSAKEENTLTLINDINVLPLPGNLEEYIKQEKPDEIWITLALQLKEEISAILHNLRHETITIRYVFDLSFLGFTKFGARNLQQFTFIDLNVSPMKGKNRLIKAIEDRLLAIIIIIIISPLLLLIALFIKLTSKGPIIFKQERHGWDGCVITVYKFRTMKLHTEKDGHVTQATMKDERVTRVGRILRKLSLDELPQFFNVIQGSMSIVGPRPHALSHNEYYKETIEAYMQRHKVKPGITGLAQVKGFRGETNTVYKMQKRVEYDLYYIDNWSLALDLKIIFLTLFQILNGKAY